MFVAGLIIAGIGATGLLGSVILEVKKHEPVYMLLMKISAGTLGIGGVIIGLVSLS